MRKIFYIITMLLLITTVSIAQSDAERQKIKQVYKREALKRAATRGEKTNDAYFDPFKTENDSLNARHLQLEKKVEEYLKKHPNQTRSWEKNGVQYFIQSIRNDGSPVIITTKDTESGQVMKATSLYSGGSLGINVQGQGMVGGVWDGGKVRETHELYQGRALYKETATSTTATTLSDHMCHVAGDMMGGDVVANPAAKGIAYNATAWCYDWDNDVTECNAFGQAGYLTSNHSYGPSNKGANDPIWEFGAYQERAAGMDNVMKQSPNYLQCWAAGNEQSNNTNFSNKQGYDVMTGGCSAKNILTVGAVNANGTMSTFSNWGPTDDGRIKPEIVAKGVGMTSSYSTADNAYNTGNGTSYATPAVTGMVLLLQQYYKTLNPDYLEAAGVKGLMLHSADDLGQPGPDYKFGWGMANAEKAAQIIKTANADYTKTNSDTKIAKITTNPAVGADATYTVKAKGGIPLSVSICWTDDAGIVQLETEGVDPTTSRLVYNFDIKVTAPDGTTVFYPWSGPGMVNRTQNSTRTGPNNVDPFKRVDIDAPVADGIYTIIITKRAGSPVDLRNFTIIASGLKNTDPEINFNAATNSISEATTGTANTCINYKDYTMTMTVANAPTGNATVTIAVDPSSTATEGKDFDISTNSVFGTGGSKQLTFLNGATTTQSYTIRVYDDVIVEVNETIKLNFSTTGGNSVVGKSAPSTIITIADNDNAITTQGPATVTIGDATSAAASQTGPFSPAKADLLMDHYFLASELSAAGLVNGSIINGITLNVSKKQTTTPFISFNISMGLVATAPSSSSSFLVNSSLTNCYSNASYSTLAGDNLFSFTNNFTWDGLSNLVVRYCYNGTTDRGNTDFDQFNAKVDALGASVKSVVYNYEDAAANANGCSLPTNSFITSTSRPITQFRYIKSGTSIETVATQMKTENIKVENGQYNFYSNTNKLIASLSATTQDASCTEAKIEAAGNGFTAFASGQRSNKVWKITPTTNAGTIYSKVILYMTTAELNGQDVSTYKIYQSSAATVGEIANNNTITASTTVTSNPEYTKFESPFTGLGLFTIGSSTVVLPLQLQSFSGSKETVYNKLIWITTNEVNSKQFIVEKLNSTSQWVQIGVVTAIGNSSSAYAFYDNTPSTGLNIYRLKMVDIDGKYEYSNAIQVIRNDNTSSHIFPNPVSNIINITVNSNLLNTEVILCNALGQLLQVKTITTTTLSFNTSNYVNGIYLIKFANGNTQKIIKQ